MSEEKSSSSASAGSDLTPEQQAFLRECDQAFAWRYHPEKDSDMKRYLATDRVRPPVIENWRPPPSNRGDNRQNSSPWNRNSNRYSDRSQSWDRNQHREHREHSRESRDYSRERHRQGRRDW